jgi:hypothetical protein
MRDEAGGALDGLFASLLAGNSMRQHGQEWIVDGDLKDFFGSVDHEKLLTLVAQR